MKLTHTLSLATLALIVGIAPVAITAQDTAPNQRPDRPQIHDRRGPEGQRPNRPNPLKDLHAFWEKEEIAEALALDQSQIDQLNASLESAKASIEGEKEILKTAMDELRDLMDAENPDLDAVYAALDEISASKTTIAKAHAGHRVVVKNVLTTEQEETLKELIKDHVRDGMRDRMQDRGFGGPDGEFGDFPPPPRNRGDLPELEDGDNADDAPAQRQPRRRARRDVGSDS